MPLCAASASVPVMDSAQKVTGNAEPAGLNCPACGELAVFVISSAQVFCGNDDCAILMWDPAKTVDELAAGMKVIDLRREGT